MILNINSANINEAHQVNLGFADVVFLLFICNSHFNTMCLTQFSIQKCKLFYICFSKNKFKFAFIVNALFKKKLSA